MIKVAAIAIAAVASLDRQRAANGKAFYEQLDVEIYREWRDQHSAVGKPKLTNDSISSILRLA